MARATIPDLILLDMLLPKLTGPEVLQALRSDPLTAAVPVIVLSSLPQKNEAKLKRDGATAYFEKSKLELDQSPEALVEIVQKALNDFNPLNDETSVGVQCGLQRLTDPKE